jgi:hypothetical protein
MPWFQLCGAPPGHPVQDKMRLLKEQKEKGRMLRTSSLVLLIFSRPRS